jgi:hypothetical protein
MATTERIAATKAAATYDASIAAGAVGNFIAIGLKHNDQVKVMGSNAAGTEYTQLTYIDPGGKRSPAILTPSNNTIELNGPIDFRFDKPVTGGDVELSEYA